MNLPLEEIERLSVNALRSNNQNDRESALNALQPFGQDINLVPLIKNILEQSNEECAHFLASHSLLHLVTTNWPAFSATDTIGLRDFVFEYLGTRGPMLASFVLTSLIQLLCRITKMGWLESSQHRELPQKLTKFLEASADHCVLGLNALNGLVAEMSSPVKGRSLTVNRKLAMNFRDNALFSVFRIALATLNQLAQDANSSDRKVPLSHASLIEEQSLQLCLKCLSFDFLGTSPDESGEDLTTIQIPAAWISVFENTGTIDMFFTIYTTGSRNSALAMQVLVLIVSARRTLFSTESERIAFFSHLLKGLVVVLRSRIGFQDESCFHEVCRFITRFKANVVFDDMVAMPPYLEYIQLLAEVTVQTFQNWIEYENSIPYLLNTWNRLCKGLYFSKNNQASRVKELAPQVAQVFIGTRICADMDLVLQYKDQFEVDDHVREQLDSYFSCIAQCDYDAVAKAIVEIFNPVEQHYMECAQMLVSGSGSISKDNIESRLFVLETQLAWLVHIIGATISYSQRSYGGSEDKNLLDGGLSSKVFTLCSWVDQRLNNYNQETCSPKLDLAILHFFESFRKAFLGNQSTPNTKVFQPLQENCGIYDRRMVLNVLVQKICVNLRYWTRNQTILLQSLQLLKELSNSLNFRSDLTALEAVSFAIRNHTRDTFAFLDEPSNTKLRTLYYSSITRLFFQSHLDDLESLSQFMRPFAQTLDYFASISTTEALRTDLVRNQLIGLCRDLRGVIEGAGMQHYGHLFDWLYPQYLPTLVRVFSVWMDIPAVSTPMLKMWADLCHNYQNRIRFSESSPNGILLFKETASLLINYCRRMAESGGSEDYDTFLKGVALTLQITHRSLAGGYCNFGVFELYNDPCLQEAIASVVKLVFVIDTDTLMVHPKLCKEYFNFVDVVFERHIRTLVTMDDAYFVRLINTIELGIASVNVHISSMALAALDKVACWQLKEAGKVANRVAAQALHDHLSAHPQLFPHLIGVIFNIILFEEVDNVWSMSRPLQGLIVLYPEHFELFKMELLQSQPPNKQPEVRKEFDLFTSRIPKQLREREEFGTALKKLTETLKQFLFRPLA
eukprot:GCRY01003615.1.p1 GENE.GCRY01003615.1~~GCRY01003615.1.p1  ORF type:complete len:1074 (-),score=340.38 GCRY01003615.1:314-3535(-)